MLNVDLLPRPWSGHVAKVEGYEPLISAVIERVSTRKRGAWRVSVLVDGVAMCTLHKNTRAEAESVGEGMLAAYTDVHYVSR